MHDDDVLILKGKEVSALLAGAELQIIERVKAAYEAHEAGASSLPHSTFLRFPDSQSNRVIALPAYLGQEFEVAGIKWIASFPGNHDKGYDRASAVMILNSTQTGRPQAILEASTISAQRTAASAALAAKYLHHGRQSNVAGVIGCGLINFQIVRFLRAVFPELKRLIVFDKADEAAQLFAEKCRGLDQEIEVERFNDVSQVLRQSKLISLATTAITPHISDLKDCAVGSTILHISLRDLAPEAVLATDNIVDDVDHVCRAQTSLHLAEQLVGHRDFIRCTLASITKGSAPARLNDESIAVFSPFGLGVLDIAVGQLVYQLGIKEGLGTVIDSFLPESWTKQNYNQT